VHSPKPVREVLDLICALSHIARLFSRLSFTQCRSLDGTALVFPNVQLALSLLCIFLAARTSSCRSKAREHRSTGGWKGWGRCCVSRHSNAFTQIGQSRLYRDDAQCGHGVRTAPWKTKRNAHRSRHDVGAVSKTSAQRPKCGIVIRVERLEKPVTHCARGPGAGKCCFIVHGLIQ
jgi:hypothetical protein